MPAGLNNIPVPQFVVNTKTVMVSYVAKILKDAILLPGPKPSTYFADLANKITPFAVALFKNNKIFEIAPVHKICIH